MVDNKKIYFILRIMHKKRINSFFNLPFMDLLYKAHSIHRRNFDHNAMQMSTLLSLKTGGCSEDCAYCAQSRHYQADIKAHKLISLKDVMAQAKLAKTKGATRFCMAASGAFPNGKEFPKIITMIKAVKELKLETCVTLGLLNDEQVAQLKIAGLDFYNHNLDSSPEFYPKIIKAHTYQQRLDTLKRIADAGIKICCGGIIGMGESREDRINLLARLADLPKHPESIPINRLVPIKGTPLENVSPLDDLEYIRTIAVVRIVFPKSYIRLAAGRTTMSDVMQLICFFSGANSIFYGDKLLTTPNFELNKDLNLLKKLGMKCV
jgi:biotin synthase